MPPIAFNNRGLKGLLAQLRYPQQIRPSLHPGMITAFMLAQGSVCNLTRVSLFDSYT